MGRRGRGAEGVGPPVPRIWRSRTRRSPTPCSRPVASTTPSPNSARPSASIPASPSAYLFLGRALIEAGDYRAALEALARVDPGPPPADPKLSPSTLASRAEHLIALEPRLPAVVKGCDRPADAEATAAFARIAFSRHFYAAAARLWTDAFAASPALAADPTTGNRFQAARAAALAGAESGRVEDSPDARSRARWREQAVAWLEADLAASAAVLESGTSQQRAAVSKRLGRWQVDPALAGIRDEPALAGIPEPERRSLRDSGAGSMRCGRRPAPAPAGRRASRKIREGGCNVRGRFPQSGRKRKRGPPGRVSAVAVSGRRHREACVAPALSISTEQWPV